MRRTTIFVTAAVAGALAIAGCSRSEKATPQQRGEYGSGQQGQGPTYYPGTEQPKAAEQQPGRASGGGIEPGAGRASGGGMVEDLNQINNRDQFEDAVHKQLDNFQNMIDEHKDKAKSLSGNAKDKFNSQVKVVEQQVSNIKSTVGKLDDKNWTSMRPTITQDLKKVDSEIQKLGTLHP